MTRIVGIAGSLRKASINAALLRAAAELSPAGLTVGIESIAGIPLFNDDLVKEHGFPEPVARLQEQIAASDGLLLVTPEYNNSMPGVFKNAIDWLSRRPADSPRIFANKPVAIMGATPGRGGTRLAQDAWLTVLRALGTRLWSGKQLYVAEAGKAFDAEGKLVDETVRRLLSEFVAGFAGFVGKN